MAVPSNLPNLNPQQLNQIAAALNAVTASLQGVNGQLKSSKAAEEGTKLLALYEKVGVNIKTNAGAQRAAAAVQKEANRMYDKAIAQLQAIKGANSALVALEVKKLEAQKAQYVVIKKLEEASERASSARKKEISDLKTMGTLAGLAGMRARTSAANKDWMDSKFGEKGSRTPEGVAGGAIKIAKDPSEILESMGGPWGTILKMIVEVIDGIRKTRSQLMAAGAASGHFADGLAQANRESISLNKSQAEFAAMGLDVGEVTKVYEALKNTGIASLGTVKQVGGMWGAAMSDMAMNTIAFSKASGESYEAVTSRFASFIRNFGIAKEDVSKKYFSILKQATSVAQRGVMTVQDYMKGVESLSDAFKDVGINVNQTSTILSGVSRVMEGMGRPLANIQKVAQGIMGITKASEGWQVFMAKQAGGSGGYAQSLFQAQQRGPGGAVTGAGKFDAMKMIQMARGAIMQPTAGIGDAATKQLMVERMGKQFGMDEETTQVFQKLSAGTISQDEAAMSLKSLHDAATKNNLDSKGMFDIIKGILIGIIAKPIVMIYELLQNLNPFGSGGEGDEVRQSLDSMSATGNATGAIIKSGGMMRVHAEEAVANGKVYPAAKTQPFKNDISNGGNLNLSFNMQISEENLSRSFRDMENKTLGYLKKQQQGNFVG